MIVGAQHVHAAAYDLLLDFASQPACKPTCGTGEACVAGACESMAQSCPPPRVTMSDGACGSPDFTSAHCGCGAACGPHESCIGGACLPAAPGERLDTPFDVIPPPPAIWALVAALDVHAADAEAAPHPMGGSVYAVDATIRFLSPPPCTHIGLLICPANATCGQKGPLDGWLMVETFADLTCNAAPITTELFPPDFSIVDDPVNFWLPAGAQVLRLQYLALDEQRPVHFEVHYDASADYCN